ncbi:MAG: hypothetical protein ACNA8W_07615 [Bradymonadaceae bacterium]
MDKVIENEKAREAFGLPLPPEVISIRRQAVMVEVITPMNFQALEEFFSARLPEYEFVRTRHILHGLPLYSYMPRIRVTRRGGRRSHSRVEYQLPRSWWEGSQSIEGIDDTMAKTIETAREAMRTTIDPGDSREPGSPVTLRTRDGELLAPGARWGEPYNPPVGTPLHTKRNSANFGRPFGEWHPP